MEKLRGPAKFKDDEEIILDGDEREEEKAKKEKILGAIEVLAEKLI